MNSISRIALSLSVVWFLSGATAADADDSRLGIGYGSWVHDRDAKSFRLVRAEGGGFEVVPDRMTRAVLLQTGRSHLKASGLDRLLTVFVDAYKGQIFLSTTSSKVGPREELEVVQFRRTIDPVEGFEKFMISHAVRDEDGAYFVRGTDAKGAPFVAYSLTQPGVTTPVWEIVDYLPVKQLIPAPGGKGALVLTEDGILTHLVAGGRLERPQLKVTVLNSGLNLVREILYGPMDAQLRVAFFALTEADPLWSKEASLVVLGDVDAKSPLTLKNAPRVPLDFVPRGLTSNFQEMSQGYLHKTVARVAEDHPVKTLLLRDLEVAAASGISPCSALMRLYSGN